MEKAASKLCDCTICPKVLSSVPCYSKAQHSSVYVCENIRSKNVDFMKSLFRLLLIPKRKQIQCKNKRHKVVIVYDKIRSKCAMNAACSKLTVCVYAPTQVVLLTLNTQHISRAQEMYRKGSCDCTKKSKSFPEIQVFLSK